jgi:hypothetical protein
MKIEIKKNSERIKNIIELKCNIDLDWKYALKRTNHARVYETSFVHKPSILYYFQVLSDSPQNKKKHFYFFPQNVEHP